MTFTKPSFNVKRLRNGLAASSLLLLTACIPTAIGIIAVTTIDLIKERRTVGTVVDDNLVEVSIRKEILGNKSLGRTVHINPTALNGILLLTGEVNSAEQSQAAESIARSFQSVGQVVNQLDVAGKSSLTSRANDSLITAKVKTELIRNKNVDSTNVKVVTERGVVYLLGIVTEIEGETAIQLAKKVGGVVRIVKVFMPPT
ncbi:MAG: BON domain-containing protein [Arenicellales bacterium]